MESRLGRKPLAIQDNSQLARAAHFQGSARASYNTHAAKRDFVPSPGWLDEPV